MTELVSHHALDAIFEVLEAGVSPLTGYDGMEALILGEDTTVPAELQATSRLDGFTTLDEYADASYARQAVASVAVAPQAYGLRVRPSNVAWTNLDFSGTRPLYILIVLKLAGAVSDADKIPYIVLNASFLPDGTTVTYVVPTRGVHVVPGTPTA